MNPNMAVRITSVDDTAAGQKKAEERFGKFAKRLEKLSGGEGLTRLGKNAQGLAKLGKLEFGFRSLGEIGEASKLAGAGVGMLTREVVSLGGLAPAAFGVVAEGAGIALGATAAVAAAAVGAGVVTYKLGEKWAGVGGKLDRTSKSLGVSAQFLQRNSAANERYGVSVDQTAAALDGFGSTLYDAQSGANNLAMGALGQMGVQLKHTKDGLIDVEGTYSDVVDAIARQKDPMVQKKLAGVFGLQGVLPAIRQGSAALKAEGADFAASGAALSDEQVRQAEAVERKTVRFRQHLGGLEKKLGMAALGPTEVAADKGVTALHDPGKLAGDALAGLGHAASALADSGITAGRKLVEGAGVAADRIAGAVAKAGAGAADKAQAAFRAMGFAPDNARGMTAGAFAESGLNPKAVNPKSGAFGIGQWLGGRKKKLFEMFGPAPSFEDQLQFMGWELAHTEQPAGAAIAAASTASDAMEAYVRRYMRPAPGGETSGDLKRGEHFLDAAGAAAPAATAAASASAPGKAQLEVTFKNMPPGATVKQQTSPGVDVAVNVHKALEGAP